MPTTASPVPIEVIVKFGATLSHFAGEDDGATELKAMVFRYLRMLIEDMQLPAEPVFHANSNDDVDPLDRPYSLWIAGQAARLPVPLNAANNPSCEILAYSLNRALFLNRELLLTPPVVERIAANLARGLNESAPVASLGDLLARLIGRCFASGRAGAVLQRLPELGSGGDGDRQAFDETICNLESVGIKLLLRKDYGAEIGVESNTPVGLDQATLEDLWKETQSGLYDQLGCFASRLQIVNSDELREREFQFRINDLRLPPAAGAGSGEFMVPSTMEAISALGLSGRGAVNPMTAGLAVVVEDKDGAAAKCREAGIALVGPLFTVAITADSTVRMNAASLLSTETVRYLLTLRREDCPGLVDAALSRFKVAEIAEVLRHLQNEEISTKDLRNILEAMLTIAATINLDLRRFQMLLPLTSRVLPAARAMPAAEMSPADYAECVRMMLRRYVTRKYAAANNELNVLSTSAEAETSVRNMDESNPMSEERGQLLRSVREVLSKVAAGVNPVLLTVPECRSKLRRLLKIEFPQLPVVSYGEILGTVAIREAGSISWARPEVEAARNIATTSV